MNGVNNGYFRALHVTPIRVDFPSSAVVDLWLIFFLLSFALEGLLGRGGYQGIEITSPEENARKRGGCVSPLFARGRKGSPIRVPTGFQASVAFVLYLG